MVSLKLFIKRTWEAVSYHIFKHQEKSEKKKKKACDGTFLTNFEIFGDVIETATKA